MSFKLLFIFSRIFFLASIVIFQLILAYRMNPHEFAYISFGFTLLSLTMIAFTFGFNQFLMYQHSREATVSLEELFVNLLKIFFLNSIIVILFIFTFLQFYSSNYVQYGILFSIMAFLLSLRDYFNIPFIILNQYKEVSISNFLTSLPFFLGVLFMIFRFDSMKTHEFIVAMLILLGITVLSYDYKKHHKNIILLWKKIDLFSDYKKSFAFGISVFLFTIYYQLSNILLPILEVEKVVATFGVVFIYLGIIYTFLNIVFNQIILPNMYNTYKRDKSKYQSLLKKNKLIFLSGGISIFLLSLFLYYISDIALLRPIVEKYPDLFNGIAYVSLGILSRYTATVYSGNLNVIGLISLKVKVQLIVTLISFLFTYYLISIYSFTGACLAYSLTEILLLAGYIIVGALYVKKT